MANEILVLDGNGEGSFDLLLLFPIAAPKQAGGGNVIPTPSANLLPLAAALLTTEEKQALDAGTFAYRVMTFKKQANATTPQLVARVRAIYAEQLSEFNRWYAAAYLHIGTRIDATGGA